MKPKAKEKNLTLQDIVTNWNLNKTFIAEKMGVNAYTFKMKMNGRIYYNFTEDDLQKLAKVLGDMAADINSVLNKRDKIK